MKKIIIILLISIFIVICLFTKKTNIIKGKVLLVIANNQLCVDINNDNICDKRKELFLINGIEEFDIKNRLYGYSKIDYIILDYLQKEYLSKMILNKNICLKPLKIKNNKTVADMFFNNENIAIKLLNQGYSLLDKDSENLLYLSKYENFYKQKLNINNFNKNKFVIVNLNTGKYHKINCKYSELIYNYKINLLENLDNKKFKPCNYCFNLGKNNFKTKNYKYFFKDKFVYKNINIYFTDFINKKHPSNKCEESFCKVILNNIKNAKKTIDIAYYGIGDQPKIIQAIKNVQTQGVKVRFITDLDENANNIYSNTLELLKFLKYSQTDNFQHTSIEKFKISSKKQYKKKLMHNKFMIIDDKVLITGSANISETCLSGFNSNLIFLAKNSDLINYYKKEFEQMYSGNFHELKNVNESKLVSITDKNLKIEVVFSPKEPVIDNKIIPLVQNAKNYIYIPIFYITHKKLIEELIDAQKRNVDVKIIMDALCANQFKKYVYLMRKNKIKVKVENQAGKMHSKAMIIDDKISIIGSANYSKAANISNDENTLIIYNKDIALAIKNYFLYTYERIDDKWLYKIPRSESLDSINSCYDGIDNNYNGKIDSFDEGCRIK